MEARSNWAVESVGELQDAIQESTAFPSEDLAELLDEEKCFSLTRPDDGAGDACWCHIRLRGGPSSPSPAPPHAPAGSAKLIRGVLLHSEARVVEVCVGAHDEYLKTLRGRRLGQYEDTEMCACEVLLDPPRREVLLTLKHTYNQDCVWVFGLHVMTAEEPVKCEEGRFAGGRLSSVLKEKEVNVSKGAARFLHMLESYSTVNNGCGQLNENNQLALMSMMLGPNMLNKVSFSPGMFDKVERKEGKNATARNTILNTEESDTIGYEVDKDLSAVPRVADGNDDNCNNIESKMKELAITSEQRNTSREPASEGNNNTTCSNLSCTTEPRTMPSVESQDGLVGKLFTLMGSLGHGLPGQYNTQGQCGVRTEPSPPPTSAPDCPPKPPAASSQGHAPPGCPTMQTLMQSLSRIPAPVNNFRPSHSAPGPAHSTPRARTSDNNNDWLADGECGGLSLEGNGLLLREIENMIDCKFAQMEQRIVQRIEQKIAEKAESDSKRLENIEEQLSRLCEHLLR